ncbi:uncharacterized protein RAG0_07900 [Rhynchosporium agropyri]|uniref:Uncharacterized protein n=1 Tax=Rhynchosporium agropyri TaxID=914238 RepID=A0A1E1KNF4_9HELO|nr:uncharacterized protein RAG0_07900 [Rhynchosporium agropyri]
MDPVRILSLVCNICQLCENGAKALIKAKQIYDFETVCHLIVQDRKDNE